MVNKDVYINSRLT